MTVVSRIFTWVDIDARLTEAAISRQWPSWLLEADAWWDGIELTVLPGTRVPDAQQWLDEQFGLGALTSTVVEGRSGPLLEMMLDRPEGQEPFALPVRLVEAEGIDQNLRRPKLHERRITQALGQVLVRPDPAQFEQDKQIIAFHSFKGGVGRTLHAVALADELAASGQHVLLIDTDLEAPGITWMYRAQQKPLEISYEDLLALLHSAPDGDPSAAVAVAAGFLSSQQVSPSQGAGRITVIPSSRRRLLGPPRIEPADLLTADRSPYFLTEALSRLAIAAEVDTIVIDLRAGASELSAPVLMDPRVTRIFVTTVNSQSLQGTADLIEQLGAQAPSVIGTDPAPGAIITQYRLDLHDEQAARARTLLSAALSSMLADGDGAVEDKSVDELVLTEPVLSPFREELLALPQTWDAVLEVVRRCGLPALLEEFVPRADEEDPAPLADALNDRRSRLKDTAGTLVYAERGGLNPALGFLTTEPVRRLVADHSIDLPVTVVIGAKGAGKTFTFARMCAAGSWKSFAESNGQQVERDARIVPVLDPVNIQAPTPGPGTPQALRDAAAGGEGITAGEIRDHLDQALRNARAEEPAFWRETWLQCLAWAVGAQKEELADQFLVRRSAESADAAVFIIDGLEDWLQALDSEPKRVALRALLFAVPEWFQRLRRRSLGLVIFVRKDLVQKAIRQNLGQFLDRYAPYELRWDLDDALRLSLWVALQAQAVPEPHGRIEDLGFPEMEQALLPLWGAKLGSDRSREAWSVRWVPAALGDFNGQIQARDIVRFLHGAATGSVGDDYWLDRVLTPNAMRDALVSCSREKVDEIGQENDELKRVLGKIAERSDSMIMPFDTEELGLDAEEVDALTQWGALRRDTDGRYRMPEIYRHALGFRTMGRARVL